MSTRIRRCFKNRLKGRQSVHHAEEEEEAPQDPPKFYCIGVSYLHLLFTHYLEGEGPNINHKKGKMLLYKVNVFIFTTAQLFW